MFEFHDVAPNSEAWELLRVGKITSSNAPTYMANLDKGFGPPAKEYALKIALEQLNGHKSVNGGFSNKQMERGHEQEPVARMLYEEETFAKVRNGGFFCWGWHGGSPDGLVGKRGGVEIKSVVDKVHYATIRRGQFDPAYKWQLVSHLETAELDWIDFVSYCADFPAGHQLFIDRLNREDYTDEIRALRERRLELRALVMQIKTHIRAGAEELAAATEPATA